MMETPLPAERPVTITPACVRAVLAGRKNQLRHALDGEPPTGAGPADCPLGRPGDQLWVREAWAVPAGRDGDATAVRYAPDGGFDPADPAHGGAYGEGWHPAREMPRWASRLTLEIVAVRLERLQEIAATDLAAEGGMWRESTIPGGAAGRHEASADLERAGFARWWSEVNARRGTTWERNPWVWVVELWRVGTLARVPLSV
jgi:hypothetical protein